MSIRQEAGREPVLLRDALLELSDERDTWLRRLLGAWADGWRAAARHFADEYERGYYDGAMAVKHAQRDAHRLVEHDARRWSLRGEPRSRQTFGQPHPDDYRGGTR